MKNNLITATILLLIILLSLLLGFIIGLVVQSPANVQGVPCTAPKIEASLKIEGGIDVFEECLELIQNSDLFQKELYNKKWLTSKGISDENPPPDILQSPLTVLNTKRTINKESVI